MLHLIEQIAFWYAIGSFCCLVMVIVLCKASARADAHSECVTCGRVTVPGSTLCLVCRNRTLDSAGLESLREAG